MLVRRSGGMKWRYRDLSRREKLQLGMRLTVTASFSAIILNVVWRLLVTRDASGKIVKVKGGPVATLGFTGLAALGILGVLTGMAIILVHIRPSRTVLQISEERIRTEREQWQQQLLQLRSADAEKMERWKDETIAELYAMIMDQVERGVITCSKCAEQGEAHFRREQAGVPVPREAEDAGKACKCDGPASIQVIYPPRFQSKRTAS